MGKNEEKYSYSTAGGGGTTNNNVNFSIDWIKFGQPSVFSNSNFPDGEYDQNQAALVKSIKDTTGVSIGSNGVNSTKMEEMTASEAIYGFCAWLTTQQAETKMGAHHDCSVICDLIKKFCETNQLEEPRSDWTDRLTHPENLEARFAKLAKPRQNDPCDTRISQVLQLLSGDLSYDNIAKAKEILKMFA